MIAVMNRNNFPPYNRSNKNNRKNNNKRNRKNKQTQKLKKDNEIQIFIIYMFKFLFNKIIKIRDILTFYRRTYYL